MTRTEAKRKGPASIKLAVSVLGIGFLLAAVLYGIGMGGGKESDASLNCLSARTKLAKAAPLVQGDVAALQLAASPIRFPDLAFQGPEGAPETLTKFRGKVVLLNLWATWCVPCRQEMPTLDALEKKFGGPDFQVVALNVDTAQLDRRAAFLRSAKITALNPYFDPSGKALDALRSTGPVVGLPTSFLIGPGGCRLGAMIGPANWASSDAFKFVAALLSQFRSKDG